MTKSIKIGTVNDFSEGKIKEFHVDGKTIDVVKSDGEFLAFDGICTHAYCALAGGFLDGYTLTCYCHGAQFDISTGEVLAPPADKPLNVYKVKVVKEDIFVEI